MSESDKTQNLYSVKRNRYVMKGLFFTGVSLLLALYETISAASPQYELILGYMLVFAYGIIIILKRHKRPDDQEADVNNDE